MSFQKEFIEVLKQTQANEWVRPWRNISSPRNATTDKPYRGLNILKCAIKMYQLEVSDPRFLTYNQAKSIGGHVKKGEKSIQLSFFKPIWDDDQSRDDPPARFVRKSFRVFHVTQCEGLDLEPLEAQHVEPKVDALVALQHHFPVETIHGGDQAAYSSSKDLIKMPSLSAFEEERYYWATWLHEAAHATGHESRLTRELGTGIGVKYAREELVAELASALLCNEFGIGAAQDPVHMRQHAAYIKSWISLLEDEPQALEEAWKKAQAACDMVASCAPQPAMIDVPQMQAA